MVRNRAATPLSKAKVRQSWSKYNLYNLSRVRYPNWRTRTFFQQKWDAKSALRSYHGEQVREGQWEQMFARRPKAVIPMNPTYLANNDGSVESSGRGSGLDTREDENGRRESMKLPYGSMTFAPLERRLDSAIFRSLFASSARQARQFVVHGAVKVNGKKMRYPGYLLNPGDMFQVEPDRVLFATGQTKQPLEAVDQAVEEDGEEKEVEEDPDAPAEAAKAKAAQEAEEVDIDQDPRDLLKDLLAQSRSILTSPKKALAAKQKQELRAFSTAVKKMLSRSKSSTILTDNLEAQFAELQQQLKIRRQNKGSSLPSEQSKSTESATTSEPSQFTKTAESVEANVTESYMNNISDSDYNDLQAALFTMTENPVNDAKPYATPWMPRDYMCAFAFIPRYLEVNQNICAAVYLRHPVVRPGMAEVPSPFGEDLNSVAHTWYLRRR